MPETGPPPQWRLFIALSIPEEIKTAIEHAQSELRRVLPEGPVRWTRHEQLHLTLRFLGLVEATQVEALTASILAVSQGFAPFRLRAETIGCFPNLRSPRVIWTGVREAQDQLLPLQGAIQAGTQPFTAEAPEDRFTGHVTLGRIRRLGRREAAALAEAATGMAARCFGEWVANEVHLMRSELSPKGARYTCLAAVPACASGPGSLGIKP